MKTRSSARKAKVCRQDSEDMISGLPQDVINNIMQFLPLVDAASMCFLSKKWRSTWLSLPKLAFDAEFADLFLYDDGSFGTCYWSSTISSILFLHQGPIIDFSITLPSQLHSSTYRFHEEIYPWISFVTKNGVKSLTLFNDSDGSTLYRLPACFFVGLENLSLRHCKIEGLTSFRNPTNLLSLELFDVLFEYEEKFNEFIACCPRLENLVLSCSIWDDIVINMPNLKSLCIDGTFKSISFKNALSLVSVSLSLNWGATKGTAMMNYLANSCKLKRLSINEDTCSVLAKDGILSILPLEFKHLKILKVFLTKTYHMDEVLCAFGIIRSCLNMEELEISLKDFQKDFNTEELNIMGDGETKSDPEYTFNHLRNICFKDITGLALEMKLIWYLLVSSPSLERFSFTFHNTVTAQAEVELLYRQMLQFQRASPKAKLLHLS